MRFRIRHRTMYQYDRAVYLEPHTLRFCPRSGGGQRLVSFGIDVEPLPRLMNESLDPEGNTVTEVWFSELTDRMEVTASFEAETLRSNPFDFVLDDPGVKKLPAVYSGPLAASLASYLGTDGSPQVRDFALRVAADSGHDTVQFLTELCRRIAEMCVHEVRHEGPPESAEHTLVTGRGACRDVAVLYMEACRVMGLAARFVSGYQYSPDEEERRELHAWAEVYLPGGGWRGFDPSHGLAAADQLLAVAAAADPALAAPVTGSVRGTGATQAMQFEIKVN